MDTPPHCSLIHQVWGGRDQISGVQSGHEADVIAVVHESVVCHHVPLVIPGVQLQDIFDNDLLAICGVSKINNTADQW